MPEQIPESWFYGGPLSCFANEMVFTGLNVPPISDGRRMPLWATRSRARSEEDNTKYVLGGPPSIYPGVPTAPESIGYTPREGEPVTEEPIPGKSYTPERDKTKIKTKKEKTSTSRRKKGEKMSELEELKKQVEQELGAIREEMQRKLTPEEEVLYRGYTTNKVARNSTKTTQKELEAQNKVCREITASLTDIDYDLPKLKNLENKDTGNKTGFFHAQSEAGYKFNIPGFRQQYETNMKKAVLATNQADKLLKELDERKDFITRERDDFGKSKTKYTEDKSTYKSEKNRTEKDKLGQYLNVWLGERQDNAQEFETQYQRLDSLFSKTLENIENGISYASRVKELAKGLKKNADDKINRIDNYFSPQASQ